MNLERVALAGGTGFIGRHVARDLDQRGCAVVHLARPSRIPERRAVGNLEAVDITDARAVGSVLKEHRIQALINLAAAGVRRDRHTLIAPLARVNAIAPGSLVQACAQADVATFIQVGSGFEYAEMKAPIDEMGPLGGVNLYGATKAAGYLIAKQQAQELGVRAYTIRPFSVYGPGDGLHRLAQQVAAAAIHNRPLAMSDGAQVRDYVHVADVVTAIIAVAELEPPSPVFNIGAGPDEALSIGDFALKLLAMADADPGILRFGQLPTSRNEPTYFVADPKAAQRELGWSASTRLSESVVEEIVRDVAQRMNNG